MNHKYHKYHKNHKQTCIIALFVLAGGTLADEPAFLGLGFLDAKASPAGSLATSISSGGQYIVGASFVHANGSTQAHAFRWDQETGMMDLGLSPGTGFEAAMPGRVSADGAVIPGAAGFSIDTYIEMRNGMYWTVDGGEPTGHDLIEAWQMTDVTGDGLMLVGGTRIPDLPCPCTTRRACSPRQAGCVNWASCPEARTPGPRR
jgi:probable HAF family extracellular repeat protein